MSRYLPFTEIAPLERIEDLVGECGGFVYMCGYTKHWTDLYVSDAIEALTGYPRSAFEDGDVTFDQLLDPAVADSVRADYSAQIVERGAYTVETTINAQDGSVRWIKDSGVLVRRPGAKPALFGVVLDVSPIALERHLRARAENASARYAAFKSRAVSVIAHELRTPLNVVAGYMDLIRMKSDAVGDAALAQYVDAATRAAAELTRIAESAARYDAIGDAPPTASNMTLLSALRAALARLDDAARDGVDLLIDEPTLARAIVHCDRKTLADSFAEIIRNAARHAGDRPTIAVEAFVDARGGGVVRFEDDGCGLDPGQYEEALAPFVKPGDRENVAAAGIGLGLPGVAAAMAAGDCELHLGRGARGGLAVAIVFPAGATIAPPPRTIDLAAQRFRRLA